MPDFLKKHRWAVGFIVLAFAIRLPLLWHMDYTNFPEFYRDYYVSDHLASGIFPLSGPPSMQANFRFGPAYYYLLAPLFIASGKQAASLIFTGILLYSLSVGIFYCLLREWFYDSYAAKLGVLFYAVSVYGLHLTSYASNPNFLPLFVVGCLYLLTKIIKSKAVTKDYLLLGAAFSIACQLHPTAAFVLPLVAAWPLYTAWKKGKAAISKNLLAGAAVFLAVLTPYAIYQLQTRFGNLAALLSFGVQHLRGDHADRAVPALTNFLSASLNPFDLSNGYSFIQPNWLYIFISLAAAAVLLVLLWQIVLLRGKTTPGGSAIFQPAGIYFAIAWPIAGMLMIALFNRGLHDHYLIIFWPWPALVLAAACQWLKNRLKLSAIVLLFFATVWILQAYSFLKAPHESWNNFMPVYQSGYQNNPGTVNIGFSPIQP